MADEIAILAGGCFWCTEGVFRQIIGVNEVVSGYAGGSEKDADYESVCSGNTNHAESISGIPCASSNSGSSAGNAWCWRIQSP